LLRRREKSTMSTKPLPSKSAQGSGLGRAVPQLVGHPEVCAQPREVQDVDLIVVIRVAGEELAEVELGGLPLTTERLATRRPSERRCLTCTS